jgi:hypothetical protein
MTAMPGRITYLLRSAVACCLGITLVGACADIIGLSDYEIDKSLAEGGGVEPEAGGSAAGGTDSGPEGGRPDGGRPAGGSAGEAPGGMSSGATGGDGAAGDGGAGAPMGTGGQPSEPCESPADCDDGVPCTVDSCSGLVGCIHQPNASLCAAGPGECMGCDAQLGCVPRTLTTTELLKDKDLDLLDGSWFEYSTNYTYTIFPWDYADTPDNIAEFGPTPLDAVDQEYAYMYQLFTIPQGTQKLTFSGVYQLYPGGTSLDIEDSVYAYLYAGNTFNEVKLLNVWNGIDFERQFWQSFNYEATRAELTSVLGKQARLELEGYAWDTLFDFDTLSLEASVCPPN